MERHDFERCTPREIDRQVIAALGPLLPMLDVDEIRVLRAEVISDTDRLARLLDDTITKQDMLVELVCQLDQELVHRGGGM